MEVVTKVPPRCSINPNPAIMIITLWCWASSRCVHLSRHPSVCKYWGAFQHSHGHARHLRRAQINLMGSVTTFNTSADLEENHLQARGSFAYILSEGLRGGCWSSQEQPGGCGCDHVQVLGFSHFHNLFFRSEEHHIFDSQTFISRGFLQQWNITLKKKKEKKRTHI